MLYVTSIKLMTTYIMVKLESNTPLFGRTIGWVHRVVWNQVKATRRLLRLRFKLRVHQNIPLLSDTAQLTNRIKPAHKKGLNESPKSLCEV